MLILIDLVVVPDPVEARSDMMATPGYPTWCYPCHHEWIVEIHARDKARIGSTWPGGAA